ncbi:MAG: hypothetical protein CVV50_00465 [Spirochaetae bacterium HGW-Spirochaetae-6]|nr:MAG: hypothetical protein CVV50_00465 [Spirochaetae bacterium HGW-Spirochaetae-6]
MIEISHQTNTLKIKERLCSPFPFALRRARKAKLYDYDNHKFFDFYLQNGSVILGYNPTQLSTFLKNSLSRGYLGHYPSHFELKAREQIKHVLCPGYHIYFFHATRDFKERLAAQVEPARWQNYLPAENLDPKKILYLDAYTLRAPLPPADGYLFSPALANGWPVLTLALQEPLENLISDPLPLLAYQAIYKTLALYDKGFFERNFKKLLAPHLSGLLDLGGGIFKLKNRELSPKLNRELYSLGIYLDPEQKNLFLSQGTEPHQLAYLLKALDRVNGV